MSDTTVSIDIRLSGEATVAHLCEFADLEASTGSAITRDRAMGFVDVDRAVRFIGTPDEMRHLARLLDDAAIEMDRLYADAVAKADTAAHYSAMATEAEAEAVQV